MIGVLRLGHRPGRDERATTHVCLVARAFGARYVALSGVRDDGVLESAGKLQAKWGGSAIFEYRQDWHGVINEWKQKGAKVVHLTMYGERLMDKLGEVRKNQDILVVGGGEKVPPEMYRMADYNISVTGQPHSEIAALAVFLDRYFDGAEFGLQFGGKVAINPSKCGKSVKMCKE